MDYKHTKKTAIEIHQLYVVRQQKSAAPPAACRRCANVDRSLVAPDEAAIITGVSTRIIYRWVEAGRIHFQEAADGSLLVCLNSFPSIEDGSPFRED